MAMTPELAAKVFEGRVYLVRIKVGQPCGKWFNLKELRSGDQLTEAIRSNRGSTVDRIPLFEIIGDDEKPVFDASKCYTAVNTVLDSIQERFMLAAGEGKAWFCPESKIEALQGAIESELEESRKEQLDLIVANYDDAQALFHERLKAVLEAASLGEKFWEFANNFPSRQEIETSFVIETLQWERMATLEEIQEEASKDKFAAKGAEVVKGLIDAFRAKAPSAMDSVYEQAASAFNDVEGLDKPTDAMRSRMDKRLEIIETKVALLASFGELDPTIEYLHTAVSGIRSTLNAESDWLESVNGIIDRVSATMAEFVPTTGAGATALYNWLHPELSLEPELATAKAAKAELAADNEAGHKAIDRKIKRLRSLLELRLQRTQERVKALLEDGDHDTPDVLLIEPASEPEIATNEPIDETTETIAEKPDYASMKHGELRQACSDNGIRWNRGGATGKHMNRQEMIDALTGSGKTEPSPKPELEFDAGF